MANLFVTRRWIAALSAGAMMLGLVGTAMAEQPEGRGDGPPPRGEFEGRRGGPDGPRGEGGPRRGGPRGPEFSIEDAIKAVNIQAATVASLVGIPEDKTEAIALAYADARTSFQEGMPQRGERGPGDFQGMRDHVEAERAKFETALAAIVGADKATEAVDYLGSFDRRWDHMVIVLDKLNLDAATSKSANEVVAKHVKKNYEDRQAAMAEGDFRSLRESMMAARDALNADMSGVLAVEAYSQWEQATEMRGRGGRGPGGPGGPGGPRGERGDRGERGERRDL